MAEKTAVKTVDIKNFTKKQVKRVSSMGFDFNLLFILLALLGFGLIMVYSASSYVALREFGIREYFFSRQLKWNGFGLLMMFALMFFPYKLYNVFWFERIIFFGIAVIIPFFVIPFGIESHNATRWVKLGPLSFQPAEVSKIMMILFMASWIAMLKNQIDNWVMLILTLIMTGIVALIIKVVTDNLSSAIIIALICLMMIFVASNDIKRFVVLGAIVVVAAAIIIAVTYNADLNDESSFRIARIYTWLHPGTATETTGHQTIQSLYAIGNGGIIGKGLGESVQKISALPEPQNDMIFAVICEELGVVGATALIIMYGLLLWRMYCIARETYNRFGFLIVVGVMSHIGIQAILNIAVATNSMPNTGVSLPFISYGGSSAVLLLCEMGLVFNINRMNYKEQMQKEANR